ncbi:hypothetical protein AMTRI_Chr12g272180 [Amborella trichopoda]
MGGCGLIHPPFFDRALLRARDAPTPTFHHVEFEPTPTMKSPVSKVPSLRVLAIFNFTGTWVNLLKRKAQKNGKSTSYSTYEVFTGHIWRCACRARNLQRDQLTRMHVSTNCRTCLQPVLAFGYFGKCYFSHCRIRMLDYVELHPNPEALMQRPTHLSTLTLGSLVGQSYPFVRHILDGGRPLFIGPGVIKHEGQSYLLPSPKGDGSLSLVICLHEEGMLLSKKYIYNI